jgi:hypothetical protein
MPVSAPPVIAIIGPPPPRSLRPWLRREFGLRWWPRTDALDSTGVDVIDVVRGQALLAEQPCDFEVRYGERIIELDVEQDRRWRFELDRGGRSVRLLDGEWPPAAVLLGPPLLLALGLGGRYCLHASAIRQGDGPAWLLSAPSGTGKSTLATVAATLGWQRLCDDLSPLALTSDRSGDSQARLLPRIPQLKLGPALTALPLASPCAGIVELVRGERAGLCPLDTSELLGLLLRATVARRLFDARLAEQHLAWATQLAARNGPVRGWRLMVAEDADAPALAANCALGLLAEHARAA